MYVYIVSVTYIRLNPYPSGEFTSLSEVDIPQHLVALRAMMIDWQLDRHLLLIGNQGVGKNKLADRFLGILRLEREYLQLHRETSI